MPQPAYLSARNMECSPIRLAPPSMVRAGRSKPWGSTVLVLIVHTGIGRIFTWFAS